MSTFKRPVEPVEPTYGPGAAETVVTSDVDRSRVHSGRMRLDHKASYHCCSLPRCRRDTMIVPRASICQESTSWSIVLFNFEIWRSLNVMFMAQRTATSVMVLFTAIIYTLCALPQVFALYSTLFCWGSSPVTECTHLSSVKTVAAAPEPSVILGAHCGGHPAAIDVLETMFIDGISTKVLTHRVTWDEARKYNYGAPSQVVRVFLRVDEEKRFHGPLCAVKIRSKGDHF